MRGVPSFELVGLAEAAVRESRVRVKSALAQVGVDIGDCQIVVNLAPADVKKTGSGFDLAIAAATLVRARRRAARSASSGADASSSSASSRSTGTVQPLRGVLPQLLGARARGVRRAIVPAANAGEAALVRGIDVRTAASLARAPRRARAARSSCRAAGRRRAVELAPRRARRPGGRARAARARVARSRSPRRAATTWLMIGPAGRGQDDARAAAARAPPAAHHRRGARGHRHPQRRRAPQRRREASPARGPSAPRTTR